MIEDVRAGVEHCLQRRLDALEVGDEHLDPAAGHTRARLRDRVGEDRRAAVRQIVAIDRGDHGVLQSHAIDRFGHARRLGGVELRRTAVRDGAVGARARADVAKDHEGGGSVMPALADVGAACVLADRVQLQVLHDALEPEVVLRPGSADLQPLGLRLARSHEFKRRLD